MSADLPSVFFVDRSERGRLRLTGRDRQAFLQGMVTNDVAALTPGTGCYAFQLDATGHVLADMRVLCADDYLLLDVEPGLAPQVAATLEKYLVMERCRIADVTGETAQVMVGGAGAALAVEHVLGIGGAAMGWYEGANVTAEHRFVAATRWIHGPAFDVYLTQSDCDELIDALKSAGIASLGRETLERLRVEAGVPRFGRDIDPRVLAPETGQGSRAISYRKGCYIGQEIVARIDARGHTNRAFVGFALGGGDSLPAPDTIVLVEGSDVGRVTSSAIGPVGGRALALGYIRKEFAAPGTAVMIDGSAATVAPLPFGTSNAT